MKKICITSQKDGSGQRYAGQGNEDLKRCLKVKIGTSAVFIR